MVGYNLGATGFDSNIEMVKRIYLNITGKVITMNTNPQLRAVA